MNKENNNIFQNMRTLKNGTKMFTEKELTRFGQYLLSTERTERIRQTCDQNESLSLTERLQEVYHADYENFLVKNAKQNNERY